MKLYHYNNEKLFIGITESESLIIPFNATTLAPPAIIEGHYVAFCDGAWCQIPSAEQTTINTVYIPS